MTLNRASAMAQLPTKPDCLSATPGTHMVEEENQFLQAVVWRPHAREEVPELHCDDLMSMHQLSRMLF